MFLFLLRAVLIFWILSILYRWFSRLYITRGDQKTTPRTRHSANTPDNLSHTGTITDADFEEIVDDDRNP